MSESASTSSTLAPRTWPAHAAPRPSERIELACERCGAPWWIHVDLAGYALRCACGAWVRVPPDPRKPASMPCVRAVPPVLPPSAPAVEIVRPGRAPKPVRVGKPRSRASFQLAALSLALVAPSAALAFGADAGQRALFQPLAALFAGLVVLATGLFSERHTAAGLRAAAPRFFAEALAFAFAATALALGWNHLVGGAAPWQGALQEHVGYGGALLLGALCPAVFEELAYRGLLQGRASARFGRRAGAILAAVTFALASGPIAQAPIALLLGLHLGSLRARGRSLFPCMLEHGLFAGMLVLLA